MCTTQKYNEGDNHAPSNFANGLKLDPGALTAPPIPPHVLDTCPYLKESIRILDDPSQVLAPILTLNSLYLAYELGQKAATPDQPALPTVFLQLAAVADVDQKQKDQRSELEAVMEAITRFTTHAACPESERAMLLTILEGLQMELFDLLGRLYNQTQTEVSK